MRAQQVEDARHADPRAELAAPEHRRRRRARRRARPTARRSRTRGRRCSAARADPTALRSGHARARASPRRFRPGGSTRRSPPRASAPRRRRSRATARADVAIVGGGYTGPLDCARAAASATRPLSVAVLEAEIVGWGPSGRNGGFLNGYWTHLLPRSAPSFGDERALEIGAPRAQVAPGGEGVPRGARRGRLAPRGRLPQGLGPRRPRTPAIDKSIRTARGARRPGGGACRSTAEEVAEHVRSPVFRRGVMLPRRLDDPAGAAGPGASPRRPRRRRRAPRAHAGHRRSRRARRTTLETPRGRVDRRRGRRRDERRHDRLAPAPQPPHELRQLHRPDRARAGAARGDRLDGRRGDHRRAHVHPLLPDDGGRPRRHGLAAPGRSARGAARRRTLHERRPDRRRGRSSGSAGCFPRSRT